MKTAKLLTIVRLSLIIFTMGAFGQSRNEKKLMKEFPSVLTTPYPKGSLGDKLQTLYELQAKDGCGIIRTDKPRLYIPSDIINNYTDAKLRSTITYDFPIAATNLLFFALTPRDVTKIESGKFIEDEYVMAKRVIGINNNLINFGHTAIAPIGGFPSLLHQKSCGCYFTGTGNVKVKAPVIELENSLKAETEKSTSVTTLTGKFFSPLYLIFRQNNHQSVYAHLLLWELYAEDFKTKPAEPLYKTGKYISEFEGTIYNRAIDSKQSLEINGRIASNYGLGSFSIDGSINSGYDNTSTFSLKDFSTLVHKRNNEKLQYSLTNLPSIDEINGKLPNAFSDTQQYINGYVTHLLPVKISRTLTGVPATLCNKNSWIVDDDYSKEIWRNKPQVNSIYKSNEGKFPDCICEITGFLQQTAIQTAVRSGGTIELNLNIFNTLSVDGNFLKLNVREPSVKVTDAPKIQDVNSLAINASREEIKSMNQISYSYPIELVINATGVDIVNPYKISGMEIDYINIEQEKFRLSISTPTVGLSNNLQINIKTEPVNDNYKKDGEFNIPVKIKFLIEIRGGSTVQLATNPINLSIPNMVKNDTAVSQTSN